MDQFTVFLKKIQALRGNYVPFPAFIDSWSNEIIAEQESSVIV